jgi:hypothetical protein
MLRPFMGSGADAAEKVVRTAHSATSVPEYWNYATILQKPGVIDNRAIYEQVAQIGHQGTPLDFIFQMIPTFVPKVQYHGMIDFMVTNRWCFDYVTFCDRMNGLVKPYPLYVPPLDWGWMIAGPVVAGLCFWTWNKYRKLAPAKPVPAAETKAPAAVT